MATVWGKIPIDIIVSCDESGQNYFILMEKSFCLGQSSQNQTERKENKPVRPK